MQAVERWVEFEISGGRYALAVDAVAQVVALDRLHAVGESGWAGLLRLKEGTVPMADGASLIGEDRPRPGARARGLILRGRLPLGFTADDVLGVSAGSASPLISRVGLPLWAEAALPSRQGSAVVLDGDRLWHSLRNGLEQRSDGGGFRLRPLPLWAPLFGP